MMFDIYDVSLDTTNALAAAHPITAKTLTVHQLMRFNVIWLANEIRDIPDKADRTAVVAEMGSRSRQYRELYQAAKARFRQRVHELGIVTDAEHKLTEPYREILDALHAEASAKYQEIVARDEALFRAQHADLGRL